jgi:hypothetical protein
MANNAIGDNDAMWDKAGMLSYLSVLLSGALVLSGGSTVERSWLDLQSTHLEGVGPVELGLYAGLHVTYGPTEAPVVIRADVIGNGSIWIALNQTLIVEDGAKIDLSGTLNTNGCADPGTSEQWGTIYVDGSLVVRDASIRNTNVEVSLAEFEGITDIVNNNITLREASAGFGGQFFVEGGSYIACNNILSYGDRYLDLDPDPSIPPEDRPILEDNKIDVIITQGVGIERGELLELRSRDLDCDPLAGTNGCPSGVYSLTASAGYDTAFNPWVLESLAIESGAKLNLTNRQGFEYDVSSNGAPETVYVKDLVLHSDAVLNAGLQRLYYQTLSFLDSNGAPISTNGASIVDVPVLGFSLGIIAMEDDTEFAVRVRKRLRDPVDSQDCRCDGECPGGVPPKDATKCKEGSIERIDEDPQEVTPIPPGHGGVMDMRTRGAQRQQATSIAAKGAFARVGDEDITVAFEYLFVDDAGGEAELIVYLSDDPEVSVDLVELARIRPPAPGRPGATGSGQFGVFHGTFARGLLNFTRGTYVELELRGPGARIWIDNWDPRVECLACSDLNGTTSVDSGDYLVLLAELGQVADLSGNAWCMDAAQNKDQYVDLNDLLAMDAILNDPAALNACGTGTGAKRLESSNVRSSVSLPPTETLLIAGKPALAGVQEDLLYALDTGGLCVQPPQSPASTPGESGHHGNGRIVTDGAGRPYQIHAQQGLIRLGDGVPVLSPSSATFNGATVHVGLTATGGGNFVGVPLLDVAFDPTNRNDLYVTPVLVQAANGDLYKATARLLLPDPPTGTFTIVRLYGADPHTESTITVSTDDWGDIVFAPDLQRMRELDLDAFGNLFVVSAQGATGADDWIAVYDVDTAVEHRVNVSGTVKSPTALAVAAAGDKIYVASSINQAATGDTHVYRFNVQRSGAEVTNLVPDGGFGIINVTSNGQDCGGVPCGQYGAITSIVEHGAGGALYVVGFTMPRFPAEADPQSGPFQGSTAPMLTTPTMAVVASPATAGGVYAASEIGCEDLALPIAAVIVPATAPQLGDLDADGDVDLADYAVLHNCITGPLGPPIGDIDGDHHVTLADFASWAPCLRGPQAGMNPGCGARDLDADSDVDLADFGVLQRQLGATGRLSPICLPADFDHDEDVDLVDFAKWEDVFRSPGLLGLTDTNMSRLRAVPRVQRKTVQYEPRWFLNNWNHPSHACFSSGSAYTTAR